MRLNAEERDFILKDVKSMIDKHNSKKLECLKQTKPFKDFQKRIRELGRINDKIEKLKKERSKFDLWNDAKNCNKKLKLNWHYSTGVQAPYEITVKSKPLIKWDSWGLYEYSIKRDIMMNTFKEDIDVDKFVDAIFDFYKDLTPDELVDRRESGRTREKITYKKKVKETRNKYIKEVA